MGSARHETESAVAREIAGIARSRMRRRFFMIFLPSGFEPGATSKLCEKLKQKNFKRPDAY